MHLDLQWDLNVGYINLIRASAQKIEDNLILLTDIIFVRYIPALWELGQECREQIILFYNLQIKRGLEGTLSELDKKTKQLEVGKHRHQGNSMSSTL